MTPDRQKALDAVRYALQHPRSQRIAGDLVQAFTIIEQSLVHDGRVPAGDALDRVNQLIGPYLDMGPSCTYGGLSGFDITSLKVGATMLRALCHPDDAHALNNAGINAAVYDYNLSQPRPGVA